MELDGGDIYTYRGDYQNYLQKRQERISNYNAQTDKVRNLLRRELEWIHATPCARSGKAKYRKDAFRELQERASQARVETNVNMDEIRYNARLGTKVINCKDLYCEYPGWPCIVRDFTYNFARGEKVGIVGRNGIGKSTFINLLMGIVSPQAIVRGTIDRGSSLQIGYYRQDGMSFKEDDTVIDLVPDMHLLGRFLFTPDMYSTRVSRLSGGERRRLYLLTILMKQPNMLILDEPTNDLDIVTLNVLEEYLLEFNGTLIIVSHDRHFMDRLVDHLLVFCGDGVVKDFIGNFSEYRAFIKDYEAEAKRAAAKPAAPRAEQRKAAPAKRKLSYKEQRELEALEAEIEALNAEKAALEGQLSSGVLAYEALQAASARVGEIISILDQKELRWLELSEIGQ
jgi:ATP-binding cassette subfamily F protein uup